MVTQSTGTPLRDLANVIRSKNAGAFLLALDLLFRDEASYRRVRDSGVLTPSLIAQRYQIDISDVISIISFDPAQAIKITIRRATSTGAPGDTDVYGAQQHAPLLDIPIPPAQAPPSPNAPGQ